MEFAYSPISCVGFHTPNGVQGAMNTLRYKLIEYKGHCALVSIIVYSFMIRCLKVIRVQVRLSFGILLSQV